jgi:hypothetical protein
MFDEQQNVNMQRDCQSVLTLAARLMRGHGGACWSAADLAGQNQLLFDGVAVVM